MRAGNSAAVVGGAVGGILIVVIIIAVLVVVVVALLLFRGEWCTHVSERDVGSELLKQKVCRREG